MHSLKYASHDRSQRGFSLIEFSIVALISGMLIAACLSIYVVYAKRIKLEATYDRIYLANNLMTGAWNLEGRYYCPADPTLAPGDPNYGRENCADTIIAGRCTNGTDGVCVGAGLDVPDLTSSDVLIGMYPYITVAEAYQNRKLAMQQAYELETDPEARASLKRTIESARKSRFTTSSELAFDGWSKQFTYMVSRVLTVPSSSKSVTGTIEVVNTALNNDSRRGVHFAIISHGENGKGARDRDNHIVTSCTDSSVTSLEKENCNNDGRLLRPAVISRGRNSGEADDIVIYNSYIAQQLWRTVPCETDDNPVTKEYCIRNVNLGNIGVGNADGGIDEKLTITGPLRADQIISGQLCDENGANCFSSSYIGGNAFNNCANLAAPAPNKKWVAAQIHHHEIRCVLVNIPVYNSQCAPHHVAIGFDSTGLRCVDPCVATPPTTVVQPCAANETGSGRTYTTNFDCATHAWSAWQLQSNNCTPVP